MARRKITPVFNPKSKRWIDPDTGRLVPAPKPPSKRGGFRPGSGGKPVEPGGADVSFRLYQMDRDLIDHVASRFFVKPNGKADRSKALRAIIRGGARQAFAALETQERIDQGAFTLASPGATSAEHTAA